MLIFNDLKGSKTRGHLTVNEFTKAVKKFKLVANKKGSEEEQN